MTPGIPARRLFDRLRLDIEDASQEADRNTSVMCRQDDHNRLLREPSARHVLTTHQTFWVPPRRVSVAGEVDSTCNAITGVFFWRACIQVVWSNTRRRMAEMANVQARGHRLLVRQRPGHAMRHRRSRPIVALDDKEAVRLRVFCRDQTQQPSSARPYEL